MNRLILIGNGFDLAHGLKTSYADFINWYWEQWGERLRCHAEITESDELCSFTLKGCAQWYLAWSGYYYQKENSGLPWAAHDIARKAKEDRILCEFKYLSRFLERIDQNIETKGWVDIENEYYRLLVNGEERLCSYQLLNKHLDFLRKKLIEYLRGVEKTEIEMFADINDKIYRPIEKKELSISYSNYSKDDLSLSHIMLLNFNYTKTPEIYLKNDTTINYIHGKLNNPQSVIFGYGDEIDEDYKQLKRLNDNESLRQMKSIRYMEADNYRRMLEFIQTGPFQVCIMGHSCDLSDRTLLNTIFEHPNCMSVKPYYYIKDNGEDNYMELAINISRNFTDMKLMRDRVVNKTFTEPLTKT